MLKVEVENKIKYLRIHWSIQILTYVSEFGKLCSEVQNYLEFRNIILIETVHT